MREESITVRVCSEYPEFIDSGCFLCAEARRKINSESYTRPARHVGKVFPTRLYKDTYLKRSHAARQSVQFSS